MRVTAIAPPARCAVMDVADNGAMVRPLGPHRDVHRGRSMASARIGWNHAVTGRER
jgi:hypothetical protein